jgi:hypothetical protein
LAITWPKIMLEKFPSNQNTCKDPAHNLDSAMVLPNSLIFCGHPYQKGHVFCHQIIISMYIVDDMMDVILNNQPKICLLVEREG